MIKDSSKIQFFAFASFLIISIGLVRHPDFQTTFFSWQRARTLDSFITSLTTQGLDAETYWEFRERFSPGHFVRNETNTDFRGTFKITSLEEDANDLLYYSSEYLRSTDGLLFGDPNSKLSEFKAAMTGEIVAENEDFILLKLSQKEYVLAFITTTEEMKQANGMFDYTSDEREIIGDASWFNVSYISL